MSKKEQQPKTTTEASNDGNTVLAAVPTKVSSYDVEELAAFMCGLDYDNCGFDDIENALYEKFNIDFDSLHKIICYLLPMVDVGVSPLTKERFKGFSRVDKSGYGLWMIKESVGKA